MANGRWTGWENPDGTWNLHHGDYRGQPTPQAVCRDWQDARATASGEKEAPEPNPAVYRRAPSLASWASTHVGYRRARNEDALVVDPEYGLYLVADGMGGHPGGLEASNIAARVIQQVVRAEGSRWLDGLISACPRLGTWGILRRSLAEANRTLRRVGREMPDLQGLATTVVGLLFLGWNAAVVHVGDSRCYLLRDGKAHQLTLDHNLLNEEIQAGRITASGGAELGPHKHNLMRGVGLSEDIKPDYDWLEVRRGDVFVLCSDGLSNYIEDPVKFFQLSQQNGIAGLAEACVEFALAHGGSDNITVVVVSVETEQR